MSSLGGLGPLLGDALLVASELVTNAVRHSGATERDVLHVLVRREGDHLLIKVRDPGSSSTDARLGDVSQPFGGLGLRIVQQLSSRWGSERRDGYVVWAEVPLVLYAAASDRAASGRPTCQIAGGPGGNRPGGC